MHVMDHNHGDMDHVCDDTDPIYADMDPRCVDNYIVPVYLDSRLVDNLYTESMGSCVHRRVNMDHIR